MDDTTVPPETASPLPLSEQEAVASVPDPKPDSPRDAQRMSQSGGYVMAAFSGPIPDPYALKIYGEIDPTYPERLLAMAERQEAHRQAEEIRQKELEKIAIESYIAFNQAKHNLARQKHLERIKYQTRGQWLGIVLVSFFLMGAIYVTMNGHDWV
ncbi:MAG: DUF2335 domain-containing protein, partial [Magnetococcales bacterium]|nr:DUF2335 domain-containing protein [Magnetococcales bacterium]